MRSTTLLAVLCIFSLGASAQQSNDRKPAFTRGNIATVLGFESPASPSGLPLGWSTPPGSSVSLDTKIAHTGKQSARIGRTASSLNQFTSIGVSIPADFVGQTLQLRGYLRIEDVKGHVALWLREDDEDGKVVSFANGDSANFSGTSDWRQFTLSIPAQQDATKLFAGAFLAGTGKAWVDDLELLVDGKPIAEAPSKSLQPTALDRDQEFAAGSRIHIDTLTDAQVENLASLAEVWGFLKYHHPAVTSGKRNWDFDLFRVMPSILAAHNRNERNASLLKWIDSLGSIKPCSPCVARDASPQLAPDISWIMDKNRFGAALSERLQSIYINRLDNVRQFYVEPARYTSNPSFQHEPSYRNIAFPDSGYQLLTLFRWWNDLEWWFPDRDLIPNLHKVLRDYIRPMATAKDKTEITLTTMKLIGEARDTHANLLSSINLRPPTGDCRVPVALRFVQNQFVVWSVLGENTNLQRGDAIETIDGHPVHDLVASWSPFYTASNEAARHRDLSHQLTKGACGPVALGIRRTGAAMQINSSRVKSLEINEPFAHDHDGDTFRLLSREVAYLKLSSVRAEDVPQYLEKAQGTKGLIIDIRNYPSAFVVFALGQHLVQKPVPFVRLPTPEFDNPGTFSRGPVISLQPQSPGYDGRVVILVDEITQSSAEYTAMALRTSPHAIVVGSQTAGADGNVSSIQLPFGLTTRFSGLGVLTPTGGQTQQVGIARYIESTPTINGIAASRDEVLETAIRQIVGDTVPQADIERMAHR